MTPILLDKADFLKLSVGSVLLVTTIFVAGFLFGYTKSEHHQQLSRSAVALELPAPVAAVTAIREQMVPDTLPAGHDRDVDVADAGEQQALAHAHHGSTALVAEAPPSEISETATAVAEETASVADAASPVSLGVGGPHEAEQDDPLELMLDTADEGSARFTVQVGMFGSADNAERKLDVLQAMKLNAYSTEFSDSQQRTRYNVRFGYFDSKQDALAALASYRELFSADGYLVSIKR